MILSEWSQYFHEEDLHEKIIFITGLIIRNYLTLLTILHL